MGWWVGSTQEWWAASLEHGELASIRLLECPCCCQRSSTTRRPVTTAPTHAPPTHAPPRPHVHHPPATAPTCAALTPPHHRAHTYPTHAPPRPHVHHPPTTAPTCATLTPPHHRAHGYTTHSPSHPQAPRPLASCASALTAARHPAPCTRAGRRLRTGGGVGARGGQGKGPDQARGLWADVRGGVGVAPRVWGRCGGGDAGAVQSGVGWERGFHRQAKAAPLAPSAPAAAAGCREALHHPPSHSVG